MDLFKLNMLYLLTAAPFFAVTMIVVGAISSVLIDSATVQLGVAGSVWMDLFLRFVFAFLFMCFLGQGPVTAGYTHIICEHSKERPCWLFSDYFETVKHNFKKSFLVWIIDLAVFYLLVAAFIFYGRMGIYVLQFPIILSAVLYVMLHIYVYPLIISFDMPLKLIFKNSLLLAMLKAPVNLLIITVNLAIYFVIPIAIMLCADSLLMVLITLVVVTLILPPINNFTTVFCITPTLEKYFGEEKSKGNHK